MSRPIGYIRQQTVNCDFIVCSRHAKVEKVNVETAVIQTIISPTIDELRNQIDNSVSGRLDELESRIANIERSTGLTYQNGTLVASTLHFDNVNLSELSEEDLDRYQEELREKLAEEAGVPIDQIVIIDLAATGSATARIEIRFHETEDEVYNESIRANKIAFEDFLASPDRVSDKFVSLGEVQAEAVETKSIKGINSKLYHLEQMITGQEVVFDHAKEFTLDTYKFAVAGDELRITRYDHEASEYVGGTLVIDT